MSPNQEWLVTFFDEDYLKLHRHQLTAESTLKEVDFLEGALDLPRGSAVLDLACGLGRHAIEMATRGYRVTGMDFNPRYLEIAAEDARRAGVEVRWSVGDMRTLPFEREFAAAYSYFTPFGHFSDQENERVLAGIVRSLASPGRFFVDMANRERILLHPQQRSWTQQEDGALLMEESTLDLKTSRVLSRLMLMRPHGGVEVTKEFDLRLYSCAELTALFARHGLEVKNVWGGPDGSEYTAESRRLILLGERVARTTGAAS